MYSKHTLDEFKKNVIALQPSVAQLPQETLEKSICNHGIYTPLITTIYQGKSLLLDGNKRLAVAFKLKLPTIPVQQLNTISSLEDMLRTTIELHPALLENAIDKCELLDCLTTQLSIPKNELETHLNILELAPTKEALKQALTIAKLNPQIKALAREKRYAFKHLIRLTHYKNECQDVLLEHQSHLQLSATNVLELLDDIQDICSYQSLTPQALFQTNEITEILNTTQPTSIKTSAIKRCLKKIKLPSLAPTINALETIKKELNLPHQIDVAWDPSCEKKEISLHIKSKTKEELKSNLDKVSNQEFIEQVTKMLDLI